MPNAGTCTALDFDGKLLDALAEYQIALANATDDDYPIALLRFKNILFLIGSRGLSTMGYGAYLLSSWRKMPRAISSRGSRESSGRAAPFRQA